MINPGITINLLSNENNGIINYNNDELINTFESKLVNWQKGFCNVLQPIIDKTNFDNTTNIKISNDGDLINNIILNIELPKCNIIYKYNNEIFEIQNILKNININDYSYIQYNNDINKLNILLNYLNNCYDKNNFQIIKYNMLNLFMKNDLLYILQIYIKYQKNNNNSIYNDNNNIINIYQFYSIICNYIFKLVCISNNEYNISNELSFIYNVYNIPSGNIYTFINDSKTITNNTVSFYYDIKINKSNFNQKILFIIDNNYILNNDNLIIKNVAIVNNVINNTLQLTEYNSSFDIILNNYTSYYCGSSISSSLYDIEKLYNIYNITFDKNTLTYKIILENIVNLPFNINKILMIFSNNKFISNDNISYNLPIGIGLITNITYYSINNIINYLIEFKTIEQSLNNIIIDDLVCINNINDNTFIYDTIYDIKIENIYTDTYNEYNFILNQMNGYTNDQIRNVIHIYKNFYQLSNNSIITNIIQYDNLNNCLDHNLKYLQNIINNIHNQNITSLQGRFICQKSMYILLNGQYTITATNIQNNNLINYFLNNYYIIQSGDILYLNGINNYYNLYQNYIYKYINILIQYISTSFDNILKICRLGVINQNILANVLSNIQIDKYIFQLNSFNNNLSVGNECIIYDNLNNKIYTDENNNFIKFNIIAIENNNIQVIPIDFLSLNNFNNQMYLFNYIPNTNYQITNQNNLIINYLTQIDNIKSTNTNNTITDTFINQIIVNNNINNSNNKIYDFNNLLIDFINYLLNLLSLIQLNSCNNLLTSNDLFYLFIKNNLFELYHYIYEHNKLIQNYYLNYDNTITNNVYNTNIIPSSPLYNIIFCIDMNNIYCPNMIITYTKNLVNKFLLNYIIPNIIQQLTNKTIWVYHLDTIIQKQLINDINIINVNIYNLQYLLNINDYNTIMIYYYSYIRELNNTNNNILSIINKNGFTYQYFINIPNYDINNIYNIYCNLIKNIINILKFKNIIDTNNDNIIISSDNIITNSIVIDPLTLSDNTIINYFYLYIDQLYSNYIYHDIIDILNNINQKYYDINNLLLNNNNIGSTISKYTYKIITETNLNINDIISNKYSNNYRFNINKTNVNNHQFIYDKKIQNIEIINNMINININEIIDNVNKYTINRNLLNVNNIIINKSINIFDINTFENFILNNIFDNNNNYTTYYKQNVLTNNQDQIITSIQLKSLLQILFDSNNWNTISYLLDDIKNNVISIKSNYLIYYSLNNIINYYYNINQINYIDKLIYLSNIINNNNITYNNLISFLQGYENLYIQLIIPYIYINFNDHNIFIDNTKSNEIIKNKFISYFQDLFYEYIQNKNIIKQSFFYWLYIPQDKSEFNNNILLIPIIYDNYYLLNNNYDDYINNNYTFDNIKYTNKINNNLTYLIDEMNIKKKYYKNYVPLIKKINDIILNIKKIDNNQKFFMTNLQIAENLIIKLLLNKIILKNYDDNIINESYYYKENVYIINGNINGQINIVNNNYNNTYKIINNILIDINNNNFVIINNINYFKFDYNKNQMYFVIKDNLENVNLSLEKIILQFENNLSFTNINTSYVINNIILINNKYQITLNINNFKINDKIYITNNTKTINKIYTILYISNLTITINQDMIIDNTYLVYDILYYYLNDDDFVNQIYFSNIIENYKNYSSYNINIDKYIENKNSYINLNNYNLTKNNIVNVGNYIDYLLYNEQNGIKFYDIISSDDELRYLTISLNNSINELKNKINYIIIACQDKHNKIISSLHNIHKLIKERDDNNNIPEFKWINCIGNYIFDYIDIIINGETYDRITCDWFFIYNKIFYDKSQDNGYNKLIGNIKELTQFSNKKDSYNLYIQIPSFFKNGFLPIVAMSNCNIYINIKYKKFEDLVIKKHNIGQTIFEYDNIIKCLTIIDYVQVYEDEKLLIGNSRFEFLTQQMQYKYVDLLNVNIRNNIGTIKLNFKNCIKDIFWLYQTKNAINNKQFYNYSKYLYNYDTYTIDDILYNAYHIDYKIYKIIKNIILNSRIFKMTNININNLKMVDNVINSVDMEIINNYSNTLYKKINSNIISSTLLFLDSKRFELPYLYTNCIIPYSKYKQSYYGINIYNFSLFPLITQPSGSINLSKIDTQIFNITFDNNIQDGTLKIFARSYNLMKIMSNLCSLTYN